MLSKQMSIAQLFIGYRVTRMISAITKSAVDSTRMSNRGIRQLGPERYLVVRRSVIHRRYAMSPVVNVDCKSVMPKNGYIHRANWGSKISVVLIPA